MSQPVCTDGGIFIVDLPLVVLGVAWDAPGSLIQRAAAPDLVATPWGPQVHNIAYLDSLRVELGPGRGDEGSPVGLNGDTLVVTLEVGAFVPNDACGYPLSDIVAATTEAMLLNGRREHRARRIRYLDVRIAGPDTLGRYQRTYDLSRIPDPAGYRRAGQLLKAYGSD